MFNRLLFAVAISIAASSSIMVSTAEAKKAASPALDGEELFASTCGFCHEDGGRAAGRGPKLAGTKRSDAFIINRIKHGKEGAMPAFGSTFNSKEIKAIVAYIHSLNDEGQ